MGVSAHALDELHGRPLRTRLSDRTLVALAVVGLAGAVAIGIAGVLDRVSPSLIPFVAAGAFILVAYNLELFGGRFHSDLWFALAWGAFPAFTSYWANALQVRFEGVAMAAGCFALTPRAAAAQHPRARAAAADARRVAASSGWPTARRSS